MSAPRAAAQLLRLPVGEIRSARYCAGGDGAARLPYLRAEHRQDSCLRFLSASDAELPLLWKVNVRQLLAAYLQGDESALEDLIGRLFLV